MKESAESLEKAKKIFLDMGAAREMAYAELLTTRLAERLEQG